MSDRREVKYWSADAVVVDADAIAVATGAGSILELDLDGRFDKVLIDVKNTHATVHFDAFEIHVQLVSGGTWVVYLASATTWATITSLILFGSGTISTLNDGISGHLILQVNGVHGLRVMASGNAAASEANIKAFATQN